MPDPQHDAWPRFCCAILRDSQGRYVLERRPPWETHAAGKLTCFGGTREPDEHPEACIHRELIEELGFSAAALEWCLELMTPYGPAWFYRGTGPEEGQATAVEQGYLAVWADAAVLTAGELSEWHRVALTAESRGERSARVDC